MKKSIIAILSCLCILAAGGCTLKVSGRDVSEGGSIGDVSVSDTTQKDTSISEQVLIDQDNIVVTAKSLETDDIFGPTLNVLVENNGEKSVTVQVQSCAVNGVMVGTLFSCEVAAGKKANDGITFMSSDLELAGIEIIKDIELKFTVFDPASWDTIFDSGVVKIQTSADPSFVQTFDDSGFLALDQNGFKIVVKKLDTENSIFGADIYLYIENNSGKDVTIQIRDMSVNGFMVNPIFSSDILSGKKAYDAITFLESDLTDNEIGSIGSLEFYFTIFETETYEDVLDSDTVTVSFE